MATYTPNLNLGKPEDTDPFGNFRQLFNDNMVKIDNAIGGGGGSGGHTIVNPSGSDMPAEGKLQFTGGVTVTDDSVNGKTVVDISGGGGNVYGAFIDTNRVITSGTYNTSLTYTATEDCFVTVEWVSPQNDSAYFSIDGERAFTNYASASVDAGTITLPLKRGQVLTGTTAYNSTKSYKVYGVVQGTNGIFTPIIYSDTERVVGVWRDNKPLYQKTVHLSSVTSGTAYSHGIANVENISVVNILAKRNTGWFSSGHIFEDSPSNVAESFSVIPNATYLYAYLYGCTISDAYITVQYTKTTDVAGSGNWNTDGVPTVHYSTSEQVIGTWIDGKPLYEKTINYGALPSTPNVERDVSHGIPDVDTIWIADGFATNGTFVNQLNLSGVNNAEWFFGVTATYIRCMAQSDRSNYSAYVVLRYTKVTD